MNIINLFFKKEATNSTKVKFIESVITNPKNKHQNLESISSWIQDLYKKQMISDNEFFQIYKNHQKIIDKIN